MNLYMLIGLPGVGKSTWARERFDESCILSSDAYRERIAGDVNDQSHNADVFAALYRDMEDMFRAQYPPEVVLDATNLNAKRRKHVIDMAYRHHVGVYAVVFVEPLDVVLERNRGRDRVVPEESIIQKYRTFHVPLITEGFSHVQYVGDSPTQWNGISRIDTNTFDWIREMEGYSQIANMKGFDQHNPHHTLDLWEHTMKTVSHLRKHQSDWKLLLAALYHDIGKLETQTFDNIGVAHYYGHQYVSTQIAIQDLRTSIHGSELCYITTLIHYHMDVYNCKTAVDTAKLARRLGDATLFRDLVLLHEADVAAH